MCRTFSNSTSLGNTSNPQTRFVMLLLLFHSDTFWVPFLAVCDMWRRNAMTKTVSSTCTQWLRLRGSIIVTVRLLENL